MTTPTVSASTTVARPPRTVHVERCMGTVFTIDIRDPGNWANATHDVMAWLHQIDAVFSTYRVDSAISRIRLGKLRVADAHPDVAEVLALCAAASRTTDGYFTPMLQGRLDPTGLVKGWAIERASALLRERGSHNHAVNGGGDMQLAGEPTPGRPWSVGIADSSHRDRVLTVVTGSDVAVATSGVAERGEHIIDPFTGRAASAVTSVTVRGPSLTFVDAYATAAVAMGPRAADWLESLDGHEGLVVTTGGVVRATSGWRT